MPPNACQSRVNVTLVIMDPVGRLVPVATTPVNIRVLASAQVVSVLHAVVSGVNEAVETNVDAPQV